MVTVEFDSMGGSGPPRPRGFREYVGGGLPSSSSTPRTRAPTAHMAEWGVLTANAVGGRWCAARQHRHRRRESPRHSSKALVVAGILPDGQPLGGIRDGPLPAGHVARRAPPAWAA